MRLILFLALAPAVRPIETGWRPIPGPGSSLVPSPTPFRPTPLGPTSLVPRTIGFASRFPHHQNHHHHHHNHPSRPPVCTLYKATFDQDMFQQYVQYKTQIPDLKEFTLCLWHKFYNHTPEQPLFSYAHRDKSREIYSWVANTDSSSFYMLAINGQTVYRLNYPVRLHKWYHICQSWNGKTGEWQIWVNAERIGRGFHNLLVGKPVRSGGMAVSGQQLQNHPVEPGVLHAKAAGLQGEITLVQLYKAALTAGKAYTNHKHHHVHHFHHEDKKGEDDYEIDNPSPSPQPQPPQQSQGTKFPFLSNGQLVPMLPVNELAVLNRDPGIGLFSPFNSLHLPGPQRLFKRDQTKLTMTVNKRMKKSEESASETEEEEEDPALEDIMKVVSHESKKVKRDTTKLETTKSKTVTEEDVLGETENKSADMKKRQTLEEEPGEDKNQKKRTIFNEQFQFGLVPGDDLSGLFPGNGYILGGGGVKFDAQESGSPRPTESVQMEPAEWEVRSIMEVCSGCSEDPFRKANIISWRETPKKLFAGALYVPAISECQRF